MQALLDAKKKSPLQVAKEAGLAYGTVRHLVMDHSDRFDKATLDKLCAYFGVQLNELFEWVPTPGPKPASD